MNRKLILAGLCVLVFFFSAGMQLIQGTNYNPDADSFDEKYILVGPDSYYNKRTCELTLEKGYYPLKQTEDDPLLNYPIGNKGARPPLFNMIAISIGTIGPDALGWAMLLLPVLYGILGIFPMYHIGRDVFNEKIGLLSAGVYAITPILMSFKGSTLGRFDHDSFVILILLLIVSFYIKTLQTKDRKAYMYAGITGVLLSAIFLTWVVAQIYFFIILIFLVVKLFADVWTNSYDDDTYEKTLLTFVVAFLVALPYSLIVGVVNFLLLSVVFVVGIWLFYIFIGYIEFKGINVRPWVLITLMVGLTGGMFFLYMVYTNGMNIPMISKIADTVFGGVYTGKMFSTISEGQIQTLSEMVVSIGVMVFWFSFVGLYMLFIRKTFDKSFLFLATVLGVGMWLSTTAGRFVSTVSVILIIFAVYAFVDLLKQTRGNKFHQAIAIGIVALVFLPSIGASTYQSFDHYNCGFEKSWTDACSWIVDQDKGMPDAEKPALLGWWDYGFFISTMGKHPVVADNYQSGIESSANYLTSKSEKEVLATMIIRLTESEKEGATRSNPKGKLNPELKSVFGEELTGLLEDPAKNAPSFNTPVGNTSVRVSDFNAMYHDATAYLCEQNTLSELVDIYSTVSDITGHYIGYIVVTERDVEELLPIIMYLADKQMDENDTMAHKLWNYEELEYFKNVYSAHGIKIYKYMVVRK